MKESVHITIDVHEENSGILEVIQSRGLDAVQEYMETSDVMLELGDYKVMLEIKRGSDFSHSLHSGRLSDQIIRCYEQSDLPILIIESWKPWVSDSDNDASIEKKMTGFQSTLITMNLRIATFETKTSQETTDLICSIADKLLRGKLQVIKRPITIEKELSRSMRLLCSLDHVGREGAMKLLDEYGTPANALKSINTWPDLNIGLTVERCKIIKEAYGDSETESRRK